MQRVFVRHYPQGTLGRPHLRLRQRGQRRPAREPRYQDLAPGDQVGQTGARVRVRPPAARPGRRRPRSRSTRSAARAAPQLSSQEPSPATTSARRSTRRSSRRASRRWPSSAACPAPSWRWTSPTARSSASAPIPTFDPSIFTRPTLPPALYKRLSSEKTGAPLSDRAIQGLYPTGSTFKPITAVGGARGRADHARHAGHRHRLDHGRRDQVRERRAGRSTGRSRCRPRSRSPRTSTSTSSASRPTTTSRSRSRPGPQNLGIGSPTGIDLPAEGAGLVPTPEWRNQLYEQGNTDRPWAVGDNINLAVGQGDLQTNPLQMAVAYAAIANGGDLVRPHLARAASRTRAGASCRSSTRRRAATSTSRRSTASAILAGLHAAAMEPGGTSYPVFGGFPVEIAGKTGTAERGLYEADQSWYVALAPYPDPRSSSRSRSSTAASAPTPPLRPRPQILATLLRAPQRPGPRAPEDALRLAPDRDERRVLRLTTDGHRPSPSPASPARSTPRPRPFPTRAPQRRRAHRDRLPRPAARIRGDRADQLQHLHPRRHHEGRRRRATHTSS